MRRGVLLLVCIAAGFLLLRYWNRRSRNLGQRRPGVDSIAEDFMRRRDEDDDL